ncbi:MAG TPA: hypothetical protein DD414_12095 [Lachnospiraceae bacterium]|nr:hypothetical protein [Lachnospiraceae bacterium]
MRKGENIYKRKDGRWEARVKTGRLPDGRVVYKSLYADSYQAIKEKKKTYEHSLAAGDRSPGRTDAQKGIPTYGGLALAWLREQKDRNWSPGTYNKYKNCLHQYILPYWKDRLYEELAQEDYEALMKFLHPCVSGSLVCTVNTVIRGIGRFAARTEGLPFRLVLSSAKEERRGVRRTEILTDAEKERLVRYAAAHPTLTNLGILIFLYEGVRLGELCALRWKDVDLANRLLYVRQSLQRIQVSEGDADAPKTMLYFGPTKNGQNRAVPIHPFLFPLLEEERKRHHSGDFVLSGTAKPAEPRTFTNRFHRSVEACGLRKIHVHLLRHTFASSCIEAGVDIKALSEILGHRTVKITMDRYVHLSMKYKQEQLGILRVPSINRQNFRL